MRPRPAVAVRVLVALVLLGVGFAGGVAAALLQAWWWGLLLGLAAVASAAFSLPPGGWRFAFVLGWVGALGCVVLPRAEGDYLIAATGSGYTLLGGSFLVLLAALTTLPAPGSRRRDTADDPLDSPR